MDLDNITYESVLGRTVRTVTFSDEEIDSLRKQKILVTGAGGSIGSRIVLALDRIGGIEYLAVDRDESALH